ncbi:ATP-binding protein [Hydrogenophaga sp.]|uniref:hybrid sensor histidine kinase/response regulator n=1 Tax=Hydrogenophaga sp. TaxID=1904254 RepID=UPI003F7222ED
MPSAEVFRRGLLAAALLLLCVVAFAPMPAAGAQMNAALRVADAPREPLLLWRHLRVLQNLAGAELTPAEASAAIEAGGADVMSLRRPEHSLGRRPTPVWARFTVEHAGDEAIDLVLAQRYPTIEHLELYQQQGSQWERILGTHETARAMFERDRFPNFHLSLQPGERAEYLVKMQTVAPLRWVLSVQEPGTFATEQRWHDWALAFGYTVPLSVLLLVAFLYRLNTTPGLGFFMGLTLADIVATTWIAGFAAELLPTVSGEQLRTIGHVAYAAMLFFGPRHALAFAGAASPRRLRLAAQVLSVAGPAAVLVALWFDPSTAAAMPGPLGFIMAALCCAMAWHAHRQGQPHALAYIAAWSAYLVTTLLYFFVRLEVWPLEVLPLMIFGQSLGLTLLMGHTVARAVVDRDGHLRVALQEAESQQRQIESMGAERERLFAAASHDLRQPLQAIAINVELLQHRLNAATPRDSDDDRALLDRMQAALTGTNELLESLLDLRLDAFSQAAVEHVPVELAPLLERLGAEYRSSTAARGLMLRVAPTRAWVRADPQRLERVLRNLLANAVRYTESGWVLMGVRRGPGAHWRIQVMDTGAGIDPLRAEQLFGEHVRGVHERAAGASAPGGYGLGLYIVQRLADAMGARVGVRPRTRNWHEGSVFEIVLPSCAPVLPAPTPAPQARAPRPLLGRRVLLVDDDRASREALAAGLAELGAQVDARPMPPEAPIDPHTWHAVVCDLDLGARRTGLDLLMEQGSGLRVLVSGRLTPDTVAQASAHGIVPLQKPVSLAMLAQVIDHDVGVADLQPASEAGR